MGGPDEENGVDSGGAKRGFWPNIGLPNLVPRRWRQHERRPALDRSDRPVAVVVRGQAATYQGEGRTLTSLQEELTVVRDKLEASGYDVVLLDEGEFANFEQLLEDGLRERLVLFHYAGHALPAGLLLQARDGDEYTLTPDQLANLLKPCVNLRLLFLNGCYAENQLDVFDATLLEFESETAVDYAFVGATGLITDAVAAAFAVALYEDLARGADLDTAARDAMLRVRREANGDGQDADTAVSALRFHPRQQKQFRLADGAALIYYVIYEQARMVRLAPFYVYLLVVAIVGVLFALAAYAWDTSPAFQTAFGLQPSRIIDKFILYADGLPPDAPLRPEMGYGADEEFAHLFRKCSDWAANNPRRIIISGALKNLDPRYGRNIDMARTVVLAFSLFIIVLLASSMRFPRGVPLLSHTRAGTARAELASFARTPIGIVFLAVIVLGTVLLCLYHLRWAPKSLAYYWPDSREDFKYSGTRLEQRWALLHCFDEVWRNAGTGVRALIRSASADSNVGPIRWTEFIDHIESNDTKMSALYRSLYVKPYVLLMVNSIANFLFLILPIAYAITMVARYNWYWVDLGLCRAMVLFRSPEVNGERILSALDAVREQAQLSMRSFSTIMAVTASVGLFEAFYGRVTLAGSAQMMTIIAVLVIAMGGSVIMLVVMGVYRHKASLLFQLRRRQDHSEQLDSDGRIAGALRSLTVMRPPDLFLLAYSAVVILLAILELSHQTNFADIA